MLKRLPHSHSFLVPLVGLVLLTALAATGGLGTERAEAASRPGLTYGGSTSQQADVFLRKSRNRRQLVRLSVDWFAPASRCTNGREYSSFTLLDPESSGRISIRRHGRFSKRDVFVDQDSEGWFIEEFSISGRFRGKRARGAFRVHVTERNPAGVVTNQCDTGRVGWSAVD